MYLGISSNAYLKGVSAIVHVIREIAMSDTKKIYRITCPKCGEDNIRGVLKCDYCNTPLPTRSLKEELVSWIGALITVAVVTAIFALIYRVATK